MTRVLRVFPQRTSYTPDDGMVWIGEPAPLLIPPHDEVHISCVFTWDKEHCEQLKYQWEAWTDKPVLIGGPAYGSPANGFTQGRYVKSNIIFTSRGCNNTQALVRVYFSVAPVWILPTRRKPRRQAWTQGFVV